MQSQTVGWVRVGGGSEADRERSRETKRRPAGLSREYRVPGRRAFLPTGPVAELGGRVWSCCAQTCCRTRPGRDPLRSPWSRQPPSGRKQSQRVLK